MDFWCLFRVVPRYLISGRIRYFPERFPHPRLNPGNPPLSLFLFCLPREISSHYNFFSIFPFPLFFSSSLSFHFHPHISTHSPPHKSPPHPPPHHLFGTLWLAKGHLTPLFGKLLLAKENTSSSTLQSNPPLLFNCNFFTKSQTYKSFSFTFLFPFFISLHQEPNPSFHHLHLLLHLHQGNHHHFSNLASSSSSFISMESTTKVNNNSTKAPPSSSSLHQNKGLHHLQPLLWIWTVASFVDRIAVDPFGDIVNLDPSERIELHTTVRSEYSYSPRLVYFLVSLCFHIMYTCIFKSCL